VNDSRNIEEEAEADVDGKVRPTSSDEENGERRKNYSQNQNQNILSFHLPLGNTLFSFSLLCNSRKLF
jgi:hypothetical protein